jgi:antitoxin VapB
LLLVTCAKRSGLIASLSRIVCVGDVPSELQKKTEAAAFVNASLWNATKPGTTGAELYKVAADAYAKVGYANEINLHHQGGAAGYKTREWVAHPQSNEVVKLNQAFAWNPSITGTKIEDTVTVTDKGIENITTSDDEPKIETEINGQIYHSPGIISL